MLPGDFYQNADVRHLETYAIVNGVRREIQSATLDCVLSGDLPRQVVSDGSTSGSTGTIVWAPQKDAVDDLEVSPWHKSAGWPPSSGDRVRIYATDGHVSYPRFTGVIDKTTGSVGGDYESSIIDDRDRFNRPFTHEALLRSHVPYAEGGWYRRIGLNYWYLLTRALRRVNTYNVPPALPTSAVSVPMQGSAWPEVGSLVDAEGVGNQLHAVFHLAPWGYSASSAELSYNPAVRDSITRNLQITFIVADNHSGDAHIRLYYGSNPDHRIRVRVWSDRSVTAYMNNTSVVEFSAAQMRDATNVTLLIKGNAWEMRNNNNQRAEGSQSRPGSATMDRVELSLDGYARIAGIQVHRPSSTNEFLSVGFTPSTTFERGFLAPSMDMTPRMEGRRVQDLVEEICEATLTAYWWDEMGVFRMIAADRLHNKPSVQTITALDDITALSWEDSLLSVRSQVSVVWKDPVISRGQRSRTELFRGRGDSMDSDDEKVVFASPDDRTEWFGVDQNPHLLNDSNWGTYNRGRGSFMGVHYMDDDNNERPTSSFSTSITSERAGHVAVKITHIAGSYGSNVEAHLKTSENASALRDRLQGDPLPVIRGRGVGEWVDEETTSSITGPSHAPALTHDLGYWGHRGYGSNIGDSAALRIADYLAEMLTVPRPTIRGVTVTYDPRRQLGDTVTLNVGILDVTLRVLIVEIKESHSRGHHEQVLSVRVMSVNSRRRVTYEELEDAWAGGNYQGLQAVWQGLTYSNFSNNTMQGAPNHG